jgi:hypothetical protein
MKAVKQLKKPETNAIKTTHGLDFEVAQHPLFGMLFRVGTCHGLWGVDEKSYFILAVVNDNPHDGHLEDVFEWFEHSCRRDGKDLKVLEIFDQIFYRHLIEKRGFEPIDGENVVKKYHHEKSLSKNENRHNKR